MASVANRSILLVEDIELSGSETRESSQEILRKGCLKDVGWWPQGLCCEISLWNTVRTVTRMHHFKKLARYQTT